MKDWLELTKLTRDKELVVERGSDKGVRNSN